MTVFWLSTAGFWIGVWASAGYAMVSRKGGVK